MPKTPKETAKATPKKTARPASALLKRPAIPPAKPTVKLPAKTAATVPVKTGKAAPVKTLMNGKKLHGSRPGGNAPAPAPVDPSAKSAAKAAAKPPAAALTKSRAISQPTTQIHTPSNGVKMKPQNSIAHKVAKGSAKIESPKPAPPRVVMIPAPIRPAGSTATKPIAQKAPAKGSGERGDSGVAAVRFPNNSPVPQAPVPTDGKPKKNLAGLGVRDLEHYRELLLAKRRELVGDMTSMEREALRSANGTNLSNLPLHMADMGTDNYEQEFTLGLVEKERGLLRELNRALAKIQDGTYGICEGTSKPINQPRLEAQPWARFSIEYARMMERGLVRR